MKSFLLFAFNTLENFAGPIDFDYTLKDLWFLSVPLFAFLALIPALIVKKIAYKSPSSSVKKSNITPNQAFWVTYTLIFSFLALLVILSPGSV